MREPRTGRPSRLEILHVLTCDELAGTELMLANLVERLDRRRFRVRVATLASPGPIAERLRTGGIEVHSLGGHGFAAAAVRFARLLRRERCDVVVAYGFKATLACRVLVWLAAPDASFVSGVRGLHVTDVEDLQSIKSRLVLKVERGTSSLVSVYDVNSRGAVELLAASGIDRRRLRYIPNGIDVEVWQTQSHNSAGDVPTVLCVARFSRLKRHADLLHALGRLRDAGTEFRTILVGDGPLLPASRDLVCALDLGHVVEFRGRVDQADVRQLMARAVVFCLPSLWEGMPGSIMEAMASGLPVVATNVNGINELVVDGETGFLVPPKRPDLLGAALSSLLSDRERAYTLGAAGRRRIERSFTLERMVREKEDLYTAIAEGR